MISYELAKALKDKGYPQQEPGQYLYPSEPYMSGSDVSAKVPTLEEVIEELADPLSYFSLEQHSNDWRAGFLSESYKRAKNIQGFMQGFCSGSTPLEAVCNLWLKIHP